MHLLQELLMKRKDHRHLQTEVMMFTQMGLLLGPGINFGLKHFNVHIYETFYLNELTAPGYVMTGLMILGGFMVLIMFQEPPLATHSIVSKDMKYHSRTEFLSLGTLTICTMNFVRLFNQTTLETIVTPFTQQFYNWGALYNSFFYGSITIIFLGWFILIRIVTTKYGIQERMLLLIGHLFEGAAFIIYFVKFVQNNAYLELWVFCVGGFLLISGLPFFMVCISALLSKMVHQSLQGFAQGILMSVSSFGCIVGPLWGGVGLDIGNLELFGVLLGCWALLSPLLMISFRSLVPLKEEMGERQPLILNSDQEEIRMDNKSKIDLSDLS